MIDERRNASLKKVHPHWLAPTKQGPSDSLWLLAVPIFCSGGRCKGVSFCAEWDGKTPPASLDITPGTLVLFRGRNAMHRVTPTIGKTNRMLVVLAYNEAPDICLSESARQTFFGRLGEVPA